MTRTSFFEAIVDGPEHATAFVKGVLEHPLRLVSAAVEKTPEARVHLVFDTHRIGSHMELVRAYSSQIKMTENPSAPEGFTPCTWIGRDRWTGITFVATDISAKENPNFPVFANMMESIMFGKNAGQYRENILFWSRPERCILFGRLKEDTTWMRVPVSGKHRVQFGLQNGILVSGEYRGQYLMGIGTHHILQFLKGNRYLPWSRISEVPGGLAFLGRGPDEALLLNFYQMYGFGYALILPYWNENGHPTIVFRQMIRAEIPKDAWVYNHVLVGMTAGVKNRHPMTLALLERDDPFPDGLRFIPQNEWPEPIQRFLIQESEKPLSIQVNIQPPAFTSRMPNIALA
ncbi:MAG: hypothetical protein UU48_C0003G0054 [Candidatus Uhrbacteria bacterium GW2011_GWF2_41_16]|uniref:Uncharacterized protein n=2 Tax=Candidatus Uhriibacteriota TaxID=1752732 RepID=A0A0G0YDI9_9BACT|nr:MAG: hypothetical protein UU31_C0010G0014 [Candidatus Uhrbacteria bacterium GW2011_GWA2_41_10]KKR87427.1 MAG: hypothetical protein UU35_C0003G0054 [Candidatus Uhrbacteria bacterium GW2011_GWC2_41_11]KKR98382.1 MAG: hypothetical protein UU48_C0003G0054 [Candidatus Uhrbacteria bacterium GW2011_GWF2_41_16]HBO99828.1 hypothetical protein [Candidatus Uhrbacteria bacterium]